MSGTSGPSESLRLAREVRAFLHDLNNPLFVALGTAELMAEDAENGPRAEEWAALLRNLRRIAELTRAMREKMIAEEERGRGGGSE